MVGPAAVAVRVTETFKIGQARFHLIFRFSLVRFPSIPKSLVFYLTTFLFARFASCEYGEKEVMSSLIPQTSLRSISLH